MSELIGQYVGRYHVVEQLGEGGMATVYKAYDTRLERNVALKVIRSTQMDDELFHKRFEREAKALAQLSHPNIVKVLDYGDYQGKPYLVMEYIAGGTMKERMGQPIAYQEAARLLSPIARALGYAHRHKIVHRDVKPANILLTNSGEPLLSDFGIAKMLESKDKAELTGTGVGIGTPEYMAPEQGLGHPIDHRADIYALGIVFFELVTGRKPFQADTPMAVVVKQISEALPRPREYLATLPEAVEQFIFKSLQKNPDDRFQDMESFVIALEALETSVTSSVGPGNLENDASTRIYQADQRDSSIPSVVYNYPPKAPIQERAGGGIPEPAFVSSPSSASKVNAPGYPYPAAVGKAKKGKGIWFILGAVVLVGACLVAIIVGVLAIGGDSIFSPTATLIPTRTRTPDSTETPIPSPTVDMGILLQDDFSDPSSGWEVGDYGSGAVGYTNGSYFVTSIEKSKSMWGIYTLQTYDNVVIDVDTTPMLSPSNHNNDYGVMCRVQSNGDGYNLLISGDGFYTIQMSSGGSYSSLIEWAASDVIQQGYSSNHIQVVCSGTRLALYANGTLLVEINDSTFSSGNIGFTATTYEDQNLEVHFDNVIVSRP